MILLNAPLGMNPGSPWLRTAKPMATNFRSKTHENLKKTMENLWNPMKSNMKSTFSLLFQYPTESIDPESRSWKPNWEPNCCVGAAPNRLEPRDGE